VKRLLLIISLLFLFSFKGYDQTVTNVGTDFWIAFPTNYSPPTLFLFISSEVATNGTVFSNWPGVNQNFSVTPGVVTEIELPGNVTLSGGVEDKGIRIQSNDPIAVYGLSRVTASTDAFVALPVNALGTSYGIMSYEVTVGNNGSAMAIVATQDGTEISVYNHQTGSTNIINLEEGQSYYTDVSAVGQDLTGSTVTSNYPVAVFGGDKIVNIPSGCTAADFIVEQMFPTYSWGKNFVTVPTAGRDNSGDRYRILTLTDNTEVMVDGVVVATLNANEFHEANLLGYNAIETSEPTLLAQFAKGQQCTGSITGDPFMMLIPPREQFLTDYTVCTVAGFDEHYVNIVAPDFALGTILEDGILIPPGEFDPIPGTNFYGAQRQVIHGSHTFNSPFPFGVFSYGWASHDSYGYPGGGSLSPVATVDSVSLSPDTLYGELNVSNICLTAGVFNTFGDPVEGILVNFNISGISSIIGNAYTNSLGEATYCYTRNGTTPGMDEVYAEVFGFVSDTSVVFWSYTPPCVNPTSGGTIDGDQTHCDTLMPAVLDNITSPSGYTGTLEYKWQSSIVDGTTGFNDIPNSNSSSITIDTVSQTTWFRRIARVDCMPDWSGSDTSNTVEVTIIPPLPVLISISASDNDICAGTSITFEASTQYKGGSPVFTWLVNNIVSGSNDSVFIYTPVPGDQVGCVLLSSESCTSNNPDTSNLIQMVVHPVLPVGISLQVSENPVCAGQPVTLDATPVNGGLFPVYQWMVNGIPMGLNNPQYTYVPNDQDVITCTLTSSEICTSNNPATSLPVTIAILDVPQVSFTACFDTITSTNAQRIWLRGGLPLGGIYEGSGVSSASSASGVIYYFYPDAVGVGPHDITYSFTNTDGCADSSTLSIINYPLSIFNCGDSLTDIRDNHKYPTVQIGAQCWMASNLNFGTQIATTSPQRDNCIPEKYCYNDDPALCAQSSVLYQWDEVMQYQTDAGMQGLCPPGWHLPTETDWDQLFQQYNTNGYAGSALKYNGYSGFNALLTGIRFQNLIWKYAENDLLLHATMFWSSTIHATDKAWAHGMKEVVGDDDYTPSVTYYPAYFNNAFMVRCLLD
jgi:uncharacterized protein (TIGR02145 family)